MGASLHICIRRLSISQDTRWVFLMLNRTDYSWKRKLNEIESQHPKPHIHIFFAEQDLNLWFHFYLSQAVYLKSIKQITSSEHRCNICQYINSHTLIYVPMLLNIWKNIKKMLRVLISLEFNNRLVIKTPYIMQ